jgi:hypothetical protein
MALGDSLARQRTRPCAQASGGPRQGRRQVLGACGRAAGRLRSAHARVAASCVRQLASVQCAGRQAPLLEPLAQEKASLYADTPAFVGRKLPRQAEVRARASPGSG